MIRKARMNEVPQIQKTLEISARKGELLPRSLGELYDTIRDFQVFVDDQGKLLGCCALHFGDPPGVSCARCHVARCLHMGAPEDRSAKLDELDRRIQEARKGREPARRRADEKFTMANMAWRMTLELVVGGMVGAALGWGLDQLFGTLPLFLIVFILLGFAAGIRTVMRSAEEVQRQQAADAAKKEQSANRRGE